MYTRVVGAVPPACESHAFPDFLIGAPGVGANDSKATLAVIDKDPIESFKHS